MINDIIAAYPISEYFSELRGKIYQCTSDYISKIFCVQHTKTGYRVDELEISDVASVVQYMNIGTNEEEQRRIMRAVDKVLNRKIEKPSIEEARLVAKSKMLGKDVFEANGCRYIVLDNRVLLLECLVESGEVELLPGISGFVTAISGKAEVFYRSPFYRCTEIKIKSREGLKSVRGLFYSCELLTNLDLSEFNLSNCIDMTSVCFMCNRLRNINLKGADTSKIKSMRKAFVGCSSLSEIDLSSCEPKALVDMEQMFKGCTSLMEVNLERFGDIQNIKSHAGMWHNTSSKIKVKWKR